MLIKQLRENKGSLRRIKLSILLKNTHKHNGIVSNVRRKYDGEIEAKQDDSLGAWGYAESQN